MTNRNFGAILERSVRRNGVSISKLAFELKVSRPKIYRWFRQQDLDLLTVVKVERVMGVNPIGRIVELYGFSSRDFGYLPENSDRSRTEPDEVKSWMERYISLLENYNGLLSRRKYAQKLLPLSRLHPSARDQADADHHMR